MANPIQITTVDCSSTNQMTCSKQTLPQTGRSYFRFTASTTATGNVGVPSTLLGIYTRAIQGKAHQDMSPGKCVGAGNVAADCGNSRGALHECCCPELDRKTKPYLRTYFEDRVINQIMTSSSFQTDGSQFNLAIFCSGWLLGESILLFRLIDRLAKREIPCTLNVTLIDGQYGAPLASAAPLEQSGIGAAMKQFLKEVGAFATNQIRISGSFFISDADYKLAAAQGRVPKHNLLIATDTTGGYTHMGNMDEIGGMGNADPLILEKELKTQGLHTKDVGVCLVDPNGKPAACYTPIPLCYQLLLRHQ